MTKKPSGLNLGDVYKAVFVPKAGLIGVMSLVHFYESEFLKLGGEIRYDTEVTRLLVEPREPLGLPGEPYFWQEAHVAGAETAAGELRAEKTVVATGPWLAQLLDAVGIECHVKARKRQVFSVKAETEASGNFYTQRSSPRAEACPSRFCPSHTFTFAQTLKEKASASRTQTSFPGLSSGGAS